MNKLGEKIKELRIQKGWTLVQLSEKANVSYPVLAGIEKGTYQPKDVIIGRIAIAFDYDFKTLLELKG